MKKMDDSVRFLKNVWALTKSYWQSEEKKKAYLLLLAIVALTLGVVFMLVQLNQWYNIFYSALQNYEKEKIFSELFHFSWLAFIYMTRPLSTWCPDHPPAALALSSTCRAGSCPSQASPPRPPSPLFDRLCESVDCSTFRR